MHGYSVYSHFARSRYDPEVVPFLAALCGSFAHKRILFSEFGNPTCPPGIKEMGGFACLSEHEMVSYAQNVLDRLQRRGALGALRRSRGELNQDTPAPTDPDAVPVMLAREIA